MPASHSSPKNRRDEIREAAERLFREKGYLATSMREIAAAMDMRGGGSLYAHIHGKEDLLWEIASEAVDAFFAGLEPILSQSFAADERLRRAMVAHMLVVTSRLSAAAVYFDEWRHLAEPRRTAFLKRRDEYERCFEDMIRAGIHARVFGDVDPRLATLHVLGAMNAIRHWYSPNGRLAAAEIAQGIADLLLKGLRG
jgi:AcrR family transcriptional regulator